MATGAKIIHSLTIRKVAPVIRSIRKIRSLMLSLLSHTIKTISPARRLAMMFHSVSIFHMGSSEKWQK